MQTFNPPQAAPPSSSTSDAVFLRAASLFFALGDPARLRILALLASGERCVSDLALASGEEMPAVSQRLRLLRFHGLVARRRQGKHVFYGLQDAHVAALISSGLQHAAEGDVA